MDAYRATNPEVEGESGIATFLVTFLVKKGSFLVIFLHLDAQWNSPLKELFRG
jgi:hypothetical protein